MKPSDPKFQPAAGNALPHQPAPVARRQNAAPIPLDPDRNRVLRRREIQRKAGLARSTLYREIAAGRFPPPIQLSPNAVGWLESEVDDWIAERVAARRTNDGGHAKVNGRQVNSEVNAESGPRESLWAERLRAIQSRRDRS